MKILIADDDQTSLAALGAVLRRCGHEVVTAEDGIGAWRTLQKKDSPRLAIIDWMMPGIDGAELCRRCRALDSDLPPYLILLTTRSTASDVSEGLNAGADDFITKPFDAVELMARIGVGCRMISLQDRLAGKIEELKDAFAQIKTLKGIVPICSACKKVRDDAGYWSQVETYIAQHSEATFSHGMCPECMKNYYGAYMRPKGGSDKRQ